MSEFYDQDKTIFEFIVEKEDYWGYQYDVYTKNMGIYNTPAIMGIKAGNVMEFLKVIKQERDSRKWNIREIMICGFLYIKSNL